MNKRLFILAAAAVAIAGTGRGQTTSRRASLVPGGGPDHGKCTIDVLVDGAAEVEVRGDNAILRNLSGGAPQWRRFECTPSAMPPNPPNFRFVGLSGRGSQELVRGPENGGAAVVRIQDPQSGADGYTFELTWGGGPRGPLTQGRGDFDGGRERRGERFTTDQAVLACQNAITTQVSDRFHTRNIGFRKAGMDDNPGRHDWVTGLMDIRRGYDRDETYRYSCSVDFETGQIRSAQMDPFDRDHEESGAGREGDHSPARVAMDSCQRAVEDHVREDGYQHVDFLSIRMDDRPGRNDWIVGTVRADMRQRSDSFGFSCSVDLKDGDVRSVDVRRQ